MHKTKVLDNTFFSIKLIYTASPRFFFLKALFSIVNALMPFITLFLWKELLELLTDNLHHINISVDTIIHVVCVYILILLQQNILEKISEFISFRYNDEVNYYLDNLMVDKVSKVDLSFFDSSDANDKLKNSWSLVYTAKTTVQYLFDFFQNAIKLVVSLLSLVALRWWLLPLIIITYLPVIVLTYKNRKLEVSYIKESSTEMRKYGYIKNLFFGNTRQEIKLFNLKDFFWTLYEKSRTTVEKKKFVFDKHKFFLNSLSAIFSSVYELVAYTIAIVDFISTKITIGDIVYYGSVVNQFKNAFSTIMYKTSLFVENAKEIEDVRAFVELEPQIQSNGNKSPSESIHEIEFKNVWFKYPGTDTYILKNCSFKICSNEVVGLVGLNGAGKSTIVKLLCRFYDPTDGQLLLDGIDFKEYKLAELRKLFGVLFQDFVRYSLSLRENIALSDISKADEDDKILCAAEQGKVLEFASNWEKGIDENLTRRFDSKGKNLSGGQWQRIALARTFFRDAPIILLDEPSSALDPVAEHQIFESFTRLTKEKGALLISHRLSSIVLCSRILVLDDGHIIEQGSHDALMAFNGRYAHLFNLQAKKYININ